MTVACGAQSSEDCENPAHAQWCSASEGAEGSESSGAGVCEELAEQDATGQGITITLRNDRSVPIFVPWAVSGCTWELFTMWSGASRVFWDAAGAYIPSCELLLEQSCSYGCSDGPANMLRLEPGASYSVAWAGFVWAPMVVDPACAASAGCAADSTCWAGQQLQAETLMARVRVAETCSLGECECVGDACLLTQDSLSIGAVDAAEVEFELVYDGTDVLLSIAP